ncbi:hypothetical protein EVAR_72333_1 [Eumeta japonica]|uniref:Uncharacterized protein n=1 Tax=Eumeta variegata TaxID=151549 RepID=A0A4C1TCU9_EUMVA|nr:hypothetical protein EVAR_72333_1 [Eumeta japonica]
MRSSRIPQHPNYLRKDKRKKGEQKHRGKEESEEKEKDHHTPKVNKRKQDSKTKQNSIKKEEMQSSDEVAEASNKPGTVRSRKRRISDNKTDKQELQPENEQQSMPARRLTRLRSRAEEISSSSKFKDDNDSVSTQPAAKKPERKRKAEATTTLMPANAEPKRLRNVKSLAPSLTSIVISITNVDQQLVRFIAKL